MVYEFKRDVYYELLDNISSENKIFLLGPRKCGKTVALKQIKKELGDKAVYVDLKKFTEDEMLDFRCELLDKIMSGEEKIYLLDEYTYMLKPDIFLEEIANAYSEGDSKVKIVIAGSQSQAIGVWGRRSFAGNARYISTSFLTYAEWLRYKKYDCTTEQYYLEYLMTVKDFYGLSSLSAYLQGCLEETVISNYKAANIIFDNDVDGVGVDDLLDILYATLFSLHNHTSYKTFFKGNILDEDIKYYFSKVCDELDNEQISERIQKSFIGRYNNIKVKDMRVIKASMMFLIKSELITITPVADDLFSLPNVMRDLRQDDVSSIKYKEDLFKKYNICIKYPMFYVEIIKDILAEKMPELLPRVLLGSIVECQIRGLLNNSSCMEYHDGNDNEIDYVNLLESLAVEISVSNKKISNTSLDKLPDYFKKMLITKDKRLTENQIEMIPYHEYICMLSQPKQEIDYIFANRR